MRLSSSCAEARSARESSTSGTRRRTFARSSTSTRPTPGCRSSPAAIRSRWSPPSRTSWKRSTACGPTFSPHTAASSTRSSGRSWRAGSRSTPPKVVMYVGETLPAERRRWIEHELGAHVMSRYCAAEAFKIGYFCEERTGFHVHDDLCHVRVLRRDGTAADPGEAGEVVISNLVNRATVLLNYPMGDLATLSGETCRCGRSHRLLSELHGRVEDVMPLANGEHVHPRAVWSVFKGDRRVLQYQVVQHDLRRFELRLVTADEPELSGIPGSGPPRASPAARRGRPDRGGAAHAAGPGRAREDGQVSRSRVPRRVYCARLMTPLRALPPSCRALIAPLMPSAVCAR